MAVAGIAASKNQALRPARFDLSQLGLVRKIRISGKLVTVLLVSLPGIKGLTLATAQAKLAELNASHGLNLDFPRKMSGEICRQIGRFLRENDVLHSTSKRTT